MTIEFFEASLKKVLNDDSVIQDNTVLISGTNRAIFPRAHFPVSGKFPQITYLFEEGESEDALPAARRVLRVFYWINEKTPQAYKKLTAVAKRINELINRKASSLNDIDVTANEGLRVALVLKTGGAPDYDDRVNKHFYELVYDVVMSEGESFAEADRGDAPWV